LVPRGISKGDQISIGILWLGPGRWRYGGIGGVRLLGSWRGSWRRRRLGGRFGSLLRVQRADLQLTLVLLQNTLIVIFPELLRSIFSGDSLENYATVNFGLFRSIVSVMTYSSFHLEISSSQHVIQLAHDQRTEYSACSHNFGVYLGGLTRVLVLEFGDIIDILVNDNPWVIALAMRRDVVLAECLRHGERV